MNSELQKKLLNKYPEYFNYLGDNKIFVGDKPIMEEVRELTTQRDIIIPIQFGFECGDGWFWLLDNLMGSIYNYCKWNKVELPQVTQIKEKYGSLCFYYNGGDDIINGMVWFSEKISSNICEKCGSTVNVGQTEGWIYTLCENCYNSDSKYQNFKWIKNS